LKFFWSEEKETYKKYKKVNNKVKLNEDDEPEFEEYDVITYKNIKAEIIPIENLLLDTTIRQSGKTIRDAKRAGIYYYMLEKDFKAAFKNKEGFFNLDLVVGGGTRNIVPDEILHKRTTIDDSWVEIYESWDLYEDKHVFIANTVTIYCDACPYWNPINKQKYIPITQFVDNVAPLGMYNYGEPDVLHDITDEKIVQKQINLDTAKYSGGMLFFDDMADLDIDAVQWRHGGVARANDPQNSIHAVNIGSNFQLPFQNAGSLQDDETIVSGHDVTGIIGGATGESATKTLERKESSMKITRFTNSYNEMNGFAQSYQIVKNLILQFYTKEEFKNIAGAEGEALYMEAKQNAKLLKQDYDISIVANNQIPATREIRKLRNQEVFGIMSQIQVDENGLVPAHLRPMFRQVLLDAEQPEDVIEQVLGEPATEMNVDDADSDEARAAIEAFGLNPDDFLGSGGKERKVNRSGSQKNPVENQARSDIQKISQNVSKF